MHFAECAVHKAKGEGCTLFWNQMLFASGSMYIAMVFWLVADGWFDLTILGPFIEEDFVHWRCSTGHFVAFPTQKPSKPFLVAGLFLSSFKGEMMSA